MLIIQTTTALLIGNTDPIVTNEYDQYLAGKYRSFNRIDKIRARVDTLDVHKNAIGAKMRRQPVVKPAGIA
jgi:hypothetical protein